MDHLLEMFNIHLPWGDQGPVLEIMINEKGMGFEIPAGITHHFMYFQLVSFPARQPEMKFFLYQFGRFQTGKK